MPYPETIKYIKKQLEKGIKADKIKKALIESGYQLEVIDKLMDEAGVPNAEKKSSGIETILKDAAIGAILLIVAGSLFYISFFKENKIELFSPSSSINVDFSKISPLNLEQDGAVTVDFGLYVRDKNFKDSELIWNYNNKVCINIQISGQKALLRSIFLPGCPTEENIKFIVKNPDGLTDSDTLQIKIV